MSSRQRPGLLTACAAAILLLAPVGGLEAQQPAPAKRPPAPALAAPPPVVAPAPAAQAAPAPAALPAATAEAAPTPYRTEILNINSWVVTCQDFTQPKQRRVCVAQLRVVRQGTAQVIIALTLAQDETNGFRAILTTPTGVSIPPGVELAIAGAAPRKFAYDSCDTSQCAATGPLDEKLVKDLAAATNVDVTLTANTGNSVKVGFAVAGFDKAYAAFLGKP